MQSAISKSSNTKVTIKIIKKDAKGNILFNLRLVKFWWHWQISTLIRGNILIIQPFAYSVSWLFYTTFRKNNQDALVKEEYVATLSGAEGQA